MLIKDTTARLNLATTLRKKLRKLLENISTIDTIESLSIIQRTQPKPSDPSKPSDTAPAEQPQQKTSTDNTKPKVAESEIIGANHLGFISSLLGTPVNTKSARETFYKELIQNTNLSTNHNFASIIIEINKEIKHHTEQRYPITYASKGKEKLQTPAVTPQKIQPPAWKKNRIESPSNPSYHYTPGSAINISSTDTFLSTATSAFGQFPFQNFGISDPWEAAESEKKEEESEDQEFIYLHLIPEKLEVETPNIQTQQQLENPEIKTPNIQMLPNPRNQNPELINQQNLPPLPPQQPGQQQPFQQPPQPPNLDPMAYTPITKLDNFTGKEDDTQIWLNDVEKTIAANRWNNAQTILVNKLQDFNAFKAEFLRYFSNNNSINCLVNTFTTMKQGETEAVTTYLGHFHQNLCQIQAIDDNYFTASQILNQFIRGLCSSILQHVHPLHPDTLQDAVTHTRDFESAESEANHAQAVNLVMNGSSELDSKLEKFSESINKRLERYLTDNHPQPQVIYQPQPQIIYQPQPIQTPPQNPAQMTSDNPQSRVTQNWRLAIVVYQPIPHLLDLLSRSRTRNLDTSRVQNPNSQHYLSLLVTPENATSNNTESNQHVSTNTISPATISSNESLAAIFPFELEENTPITLFSRAALEEKPITAMYMDARVDGHPIKLILDSRSAGSIITQQLMDQLSRRVDRAASARIITADGVTKTPIGEINEFPFEVNGIMTPIKVLVIETTQYQAFVGNDWLSKVNTTLDWNTQELQLMYQGQHIRVPAMYDYFKMPPREKLLIELEEEKEKPT
ncbi:hypothetical protein G9A89_019097 [Geosiphon pyriformis]|nr:hypothetical protein G9A89_019097 [Geosiphon pyriformis]